MNRQKVAYAIEKFSKMLPAGRHRRRRLLLVAAIAPIILAGWTAFELSLSSGLSQASIEAQRRLLLFDRTLEAMVERFRYLPIAVARADEVVGALERQWDATAIDRANGYLSQLATTASADEIFIMNDRGNVIASSNWWTVTSLVGTDYSHRPYYSEALAEGDAQYYAHGFSTSVPGYFLSQRIEGQDGEDGLIGVAVVKVNLGEIEANWWRSGELIAILDTNGVVILSTRPDWRYRPLQTIGPQRIGTVSQDQRYGNRGVENEGVVSALWPTRGFEMAVLAAPESEARGQVLVRDTRMPRHGWRMVSFTPTGPIFNSAWLSAAAASLACAVLLLFIGLTIVRQRAVAARLAEHERLEQHVAERTKDLHVVNEALRSEINERKLAERQRREAEESLVQAAKLASLGQTLAGVAHEISQPLAALSTHLASARLLLARQPDREMVGTLNAMDKVASRLTSLTGHLKTFARKQSGASQTACLQAVITDALELAQHKLTAFNISLHYEPPRENLMVVGNPIHIEQVMVNLVSNAADAMELAAIRRLSIEIKPQQDGIRVLVSDTGTGIEAGNSSTVFDPFFTTKQAGRGLGLGLSIAYGLARDMGGRLALASTSRHGTTFEMYLRPAVPPTMQTREMQAQEAS